MSEHGNSSKNNKPHHLYEIKDSVDDDVFKYGISHDPIDEDSYRKTGQSRIQYHLFATPLEDLIAPDTMARVIDAFVDSLDPAQLGFCPGL